MRRKPRPIGLYSACLAAYALAGVPSWASDPMLNAGQQAAVERAQRAVSEQRQGIPAGDLTVESVAPKEWSDSSLGCRRPGVMYQQVITNGYVVVLREGERRHEVHVAGDRAVICSSAVRGGLREPPPRVRATNLAALETLARADLASKLGVTPDSIQVEQRVPKQWIAATLKCSSNPDAEAAAATILGYKLFLRHSGRTYTYHTDDQHVFACPAIESR